MEIQFDRYSFILNGQRQFIRSGAMHYFRLPHPDLWWDRLKKLKAAGYNTVDIYFSWDFHSKAPGEYDFSGNRDIQRLLDMVDELGLYLIGRPGPYINAETTRGGLPGWLLTQPDVVLRNRIDGVYHESPQYMAYVREWFDQVLPFLKNRPNLLMIQIENEYMTVDMEPDYMQALIDIVRSHGITAPTMHNDFYAAGLYADLVDIYAIDNYSVTLFDMNWRDYPDLFSVLDHLEEGIRPEFCENRPLMIAELQAGWFAGWKSVPYETIHQSLGREHIGLVTRTFLGQGGTVFNHYKAIGGTNWDHLGATDAYTSYDFAAPISEAGVPTERLFEAKQINLLLAHFDLSQTEKVEPAAISLSPAPSLYAVRQCVNRPGTYWIFTRNTTPQPLSFQLHPQMEVETRPYESKILPYNYPLENGWIIIATSADPLVQTKNALVLNGQSPAKILLQAPVAFQAPLKASPLLKMTTLDNYRVLVEMENSIAPSDVAHANLGSLQLYFLGADQADRVWPQADKQYWIGPDLVLSDSEVYVSEPRPCFILKADGALASFEPSEMPQLNLPELKNWECLPGAPELTANNGFQPLLPQGVDMDSNGFHEGAVWYRYQFDQPAETLSIRAQHIWAVFLNGHCLISSHTFHVHPETGSVEDTVTIPLPKESLNDKGQNDLRIFVESLGHHKGFYDDARDPRGLLSLKLDESDISQSGEITSARLASSQLPSANTSASRDETPVLHAQLSFNPAIPSDIKAPLGLELNLDIDRVNIILNGVLVGKYWNACRNQTLFYLPEGLLQPNGDNHLELVCMNFLPAMSIEKWRNMGYGDIKLVPYQTFAKLSG